MFTSNWGKSGDICKFPKVRQRRLPNLPSPSLCLSVSPQHCPRSSQWRICKSVSESLRYQTSAGQPRSRLSTGGLADSTEERRAQRTLWGLDMHALCHLSRLQEENLPVTGSGRKRAALSVAAQSHLPGYGSQRKA